MDPVFAEELRAAADGSWVFKGRAGQHLSVGSRRPVPESDPRGLLRPLPPAPFCLKGICRDQRHARRLSDAAPATSSIATTERSTQPSLTGLCRLLCWRQRHELDRNRSTGHNVAPNAPSSPLAMGPRGKGRSLLASPHGVQSKDLLTVEVPASCWLLPLLQLLDLQWGLSP